MFTVEAPLPAVVSVNEKINEPRFPSFKGIMAAKKKEVTTLTLAEIGVEADEVGVANAGSKVHRVDAEAAEDRGREGHRRGRRRHQDRRVPGCSEDHLDADQSRPSEDTERHRRHMAEVLVLVEHADGALKKISAELITAARALGEPAAVVVGKPGTAAPLTDGLKEAGAAKIYVAESDDAENYLITPYVDVLASLVESASPGGCAAGRQRRRQGDRRPAGRAHRLRSAGRRRRGQGGRQGVHSIFGGAFTVEAEVTGDTR